jgi:small membrane protein
MWIKLVLLCAVAVLLVTFVRREHGVKVQANKRLAFFVFLIANVYAVLRPDDVSRLANLIGVGRGADLVLYLLVVAFVFVVINFYPKMKESERRLTDLARSIALRDAELLNKERGVSAL